MTKRKVGEVVGKRNVCFFAGIWYDSELEEYTVRLYDARSPEFGEYFTDDRNDAFDTAQHWADNGPA